MNLEWKLVSLSYNLNGSSWGGEAAKRLKEVDDGEKWQKRSCSQNHSCLAATNWTDGRQYQRCLRQHERQSR